MAVPSNTHRQPALAQSSLQLQFLEAPPGQEFGFRLPDIASQTGIDTRTPTRSYFSGVASQPSSKSSGPPSSQGTSLFAGGSLGQASTAAMSHVASVCSSSSTSEWHLDVQRDPTSQYVRATPRRPSATSVTATYENPRSTTSHVGGIVAHEEASEPDAAPF